MLSTAILLLVLSQEPLIYSSYFGGTSSEAFSQVRTDPVGDVFIAGTSSSTGEPFAIEGTTLSISTGFVARFNLAGALQWARRYPVLTVQVMELDSSGGIYLLGRSLKGALPVTSGVFQPDQLNSSNYLMKLDPSGNVEWASYLGNYGSIGSPSMSVSPKGRVAICGSAVPQDIPQPEGAIPFTPSLQFRNFCLVVGPAARTIEHASLTPTASAATYLGVQFINEESIATVGAIAKWQSPEPAEDPRRSLAVLDWGQNSATGIITSDLATTRSLNSAGDHLYFLNQDGLSRVLPDGATVEKCESHELLATSARIVVSPLNPQYLCVWTTQASCSRDGGKTFPVMVFNGTKGVAADPNLEGVFYSNEASGQISVLALKQGVVPPPLRFNFGIRSDSNFFLPYQVGGTTRYLACGPLGCQISRKGDGVFESIDAPQRFNNVAVAPSNPEVWYAAHNYTGGDVSALYRTVDGGVTWEETPLSFNLMRGRLTGIHVDPAGPSRVMVVTTLSVMLSEDWGGSWRNITSNFPNRAISSAVFGKDSKIFAASEGATLAFFSRLNLRENTRDTPKVFATRGSTNLSRILPKGDGSFWLFGSTTSPEIHSAVHMVLADESDPRMSWLIELDANSATASAHVFPKQFRDVAIDALGRFNFLSVSTPSGFSPPEGLPAIGSRGSFSDGFVLFWTPDGQQGLTWLKQTSGLATGNFAPLPDGQFVFSSSGLDRNYPVTPEAAKTSLGEPLNADVYLSIYRQP